jgi:hypothetical protein
MVFPSVSEPGSDGIRSALFFVLEAFFKRTGIGLLENAMVLLVGRACPVFGSIVKAIADGKRLRVIDAYKR